jgi:hypothetical protein
MPRSFLFVICLFAFHLAFSQEYTISGRVVDEQTKEPLAFVNIVINDSRHGGTTDIDGKFTFYSSDPIEYVRLSYVGYESQIFQASGKSGNVIIRMKRTQIELPEVIVQYKDNPAHRIIRNVLANRDRNDPDKIPAFSYTAYDKMIFTVNEDSLNREIASAPDSSDIRLKNFLDSNYIFLMETVSERKFLAPGRNHEEVKATRISGFKDPIFIFLLSQMQSTSFYREMIRIADKNYINPISSGSTGKYFFQLEDTTFTPSGDSVYIISYRPLINTNFDGLKGVLSINTNGWAIQNVIAEPARMEGMIAIKIQQMYDLVEGKQWFPVQLNTEISMPFVEVNRYNPVGKGKSYITNINLDPELLKREFSQIEVEVDPRASGRNADYWKPFRPDSLTRKELNTYRIIDSISQAENLEKTVKTIETLISGKVPYKVIDFDLDRFLKYNSYEGLAPGLGIHSNDKMSRKMSAGGFFRFGLKDNGWKYGFDTWFLLQKNRELDLNLSWSEDVAERGEVRFFDDKTSFTNTEFLRDLLITRMDKKTEGRVDLGFRAMKYFKVNFSLAGIRKEITDQYYYTTEMVFSEGKANLLYDKYNFAEASAGFRFAYREKFIDNLRKRISLGTKYPVLWVQYTRGLRDVLNGEYEYNRIDLKVEETFYTKYLGETSFRLMGGHVDRSLPLCNLYNGHGSHRPFTIFAPASFATMRMNEFYSDTYVSLFMLHDFGSLLIRNEHFKPRIAFATNIGFGWLDRKDTHLNVDFNTLEKGYYESGILLNNLLNLKLYTLGLGVFYRYGPYGFDDMEDNMSGKLTLTFPLK